MAQRHPTIDCDWCGTPFRPRDLRHKCCSGDCSIRRSIEKNKVRLGPKSLDVPNVANGTVGAIAELIISADLMSKGHEVYRSVSPHASVDLIAIKDGKIDLIEVRTGYFLRGGTWSYTKKHTTKATMYGVYDHRKKMIAYFPLDAS